MAQGGGRCGSETSGPTFQGSHQRLWLFVDTAASSKHPKLLTFPNRKGFIKSCAYGHPNSATGESLEKPNLQKLIKALQWHQENRPDWKVLIFIYEAPSWLARFQPLIESNLFISTTYPCSMSIHLFLLLSSPNASCFNITRITQ